MASASAGSSPNVPKPSAGMRAPCAVTCFIAVPLSLIKFKTGFQLEIRVLAVFVDIAAHQIPHARPAAFITQLRRPFVDAVARQPAIPPVLQPREGAGALARRAMH